MNSLLDQPYELPKESVDFFQKNRYIKLKNVFDADPLAQCGKAISRLFLRTETVSPNHVTQQSKQS